MPERLCQHTAVKQQEESLPVLILSAAERENGHKENALMISFYKVQQKVRLLSPTLVIYEASAALVRPAS